MDKGVEYINTLINAAYAKGVYLTKFLTVHEIELLKKKVGSTMFLYLDGGYEGAKLKRALLSVFEIEHPNFKIQCIELIAENNFYELRHPTVKWHFMNLGIDERLFGDIVVEDGKFYIVLAKEISSIVIDETKSINKCRVICNEIESFEVVDNTEVNLCFSSSMRLDSLCSKIFNMSRGKAQKYIDNERVIVDGKVVCKRTAVANNGNVITVRGVGKCLITMVEISNRNGKFKVYYKKYGRK